MRAHTNRCPVADPNPGPRGATVPRTSNIHAADFGTDMDQHHAEDPQKVLL